MLTVVKGEEKEILIDVLNETTGKPYDLTDSDEIEVIFKKASGVLTKTYTESGGVTIVDAKLGELKVTLSEANTAELKEDSAATIEVVIEKDGVTKILQIERALKIVRRLS